MATEFIMSSVIFFILCRNFVVAITCGHYNNRFYKCCSNFIIPGLVTICVMYSIMLWIQHLYNTE